MSRRNLIIYDGSADTQDTVSQLALLLAPARHFTVTEFDTSTAAENDNIIIGGDLSQPDTRNKLLDIINQVKSSSAAIPTAIFNTGTSAAAAANDLAAAGGLKEAVTGTIASTAGKPDYEQMIAFAADIRKYNERFALPVPRQQLKEQLEEVLASQKHCTLCTGFDCDVRGTVISYTYRDGTVYAFCEGTRKFVNILRNPAVCVTVFGQHRGGALAAGVQLFGQAFIRYPGTDEYRRMFDNVQLKYEKVMDLPFLLHGLEIKLERAEMFWANWRKQGYDPRQVYKF